MRRAAAILFAVCGLFLLLTWHQGGKESVLWLWQKPRPVYGFSYGFTPSWMKPGDVAMKVAGLAFVGLALLVWPRPNPPSPSS
jgi:hypothetical protein